MDIPHEEYICDNCGNTTTVPNDTCPSCGGRLTILGSQTDGESEKDEDDGSTDTMTDEGHTSLDALRAQEEQEDTPGLNDNE